MLRFTKIMYLSKTRQGFEESVQRKIVIRKSNAINRESGDRERERGKWE